MGELFPARVKPTAENVLFATRLQLRSPAATRQETVSQKCHFRDTSFAPAGLGSGALFLGSSNRQRMQSNPSVLENHHRPQVSLSYGLGGEIAQHAFLVAPRA